MSKVLKYFKRLSRLKFKSASKFCLRLMVMFVVYARLNSVFPFKFLLDKERTLKIFVVDMCDLVFKVTGMPNSLYDKKKIGPHFWNIHIHIHSMNIIITNYSFCFACPFTLQLLLLYQIPLEQNSYFR